MKPYLAKIDTNTTGNRNDVTPLFADRNSFTQLVGDLARPFLEADIVEFRGRSTKLPR